MIKMTVKEALLSQQALNQLGAKAYPIDATMKIAANKRVLAEVGREYESRRLALVAKYEKKKEDGTTGTPPEKEAVLKKEIIDVQEEFIELDMKTVSITDLKGTNKTLELEPNIVEHLGWMITMEGQKPTGRKRGSK